MNKMMDIADQEEFNYDQYRLHYNQGIWSIGDRDKKSYTEDQTEVWFWQILQAPEILSK